jgi:antitoxin HigA-1
MNSAILPPIHPGETLREILKDAGITANQAALHMRIPGNRLTAILNGERSITADTALRLARLFSTSAQMWLNLQTNYDLEVAQDKSAKQIAKDVTPLALAAKR